MFLSVHARTSKVTPADIERELYVDRTVVRMLGMRRTLFVVPRDLVPVVDARLHADDRCARAAQARADGGGERHLDATGRLGAAGDGNGAPRSRRARRGLHVGGDECGPVLAKRLRVGVGTRFESTQSAGARILPQLAMEGKLMRGRPRGAWTNGQYRWVPAAVWLDGGIVAVDRATARAELLRRWLGAFGPGTETDLRWWTGWTASDTRTALAAVPHVAVDLGGRAGYVLADDLERAERLSSRGPRCYPTLDPTTMGWKERDWYLGAARVACYSTATATQARPCGGKVALSVGGRNVVTARSGIGLLEDVGSEAGAAIAAEAARLEEWLGEARVSPGFLPPFQRVLSA